MRLKVGFGAGIALVTFLAAMASPTVAVAKVHSNMVIDWNKIMLATFAAANVPAPASNRLSAIVQSATFDAVNGIERKYTPIHVQPTGNPEASPQAAAASATYTALVALFPAQKPALDAALASSMASLQDEDASGNSVASGAEWGASVGAQIIAWRAADGFAATPPPYTFQTTPGQWRPTPGGSGPPRFQTLATTAPFALTSPSEFRPAGPPALTSARYTADFNEVKAYGGLASTLRSGYQTQTAVFWQVDTPPAIWDRVADSLAIANHLNLLKSARLLALINISLADAAIATWDAKAFYNSWRPVTAIVNAGTDGNADTTPDASWLPLLTTPYFQEYPSAHSTVSSAAATVLASFFGNDVDFTLTSAGLPGVERSFSSFSDAVAQVADARVLAGFHFRFACEDGTAVGRQVAQAVESRLMLKATEADD